MIIKLDDEPALNPKVATVINLTEARSRYRIGKCQHMNIQVDAELAEAECKDCGAKLNPISVLVRYATEESRLSMRLDAMKAEREKLEKRVRCKCDHCGKMTRV